MLICFISDTFSSNSIIIAILLEWISITNYYHHYYHHHWIRFIVCQSSHTILKSYYPVTDTNSVAIFCAAIRNLFAACMSGDDIHTTPCARIYHVIVSMCGALARLTANCRCLFTSIWQPDKAARCSGLPWVVVLNHWGRVTHICVSELIILGSDNGLSMINYFLNGRSDLCQSYSDYHSSIGD